MQKISDICIWASEIWTRLWKISRKMSQILNQFFQSNKSLWEKQFHFEVCICCQKYIYLITQKLPWRWKISGDPPSSTLAQGSRFRAAEQRRFLEGFKSFENFWEFPKNKDNFRDSVKTFPSSKESFACPKISLTCIMPV